MAVNLTPTAAVAAAIPSSILHSSPLQTYHLPTSNTTHSYSSRLLMHSWAKEGSLVAELLQLRGWWWWTTMGPSFKALRLLASWPWFLYWSSSILGRSHPVAYTLTSSMQGEQPKIHHPMEKWVVSSRVTINPIARELGLASIHQGCIWGIGIG